MQENTVKPRKRLEKDIQAEIKKELEKYGWTVIRPVRISKSGYPDLFCFKKGVCVFIEVKQPGETSTPIQLQRQKELRNNGFVVIEAYGKDDTQFMRLNPPKARSSASP